MGIQKTNIDEFLALSRYHPVLDVRSPGEYAHAHIPGAYSLPLFTDEERKTVGIAYKQQGREAAIKIGLDCFGGKMRRMVEEAEQVVKEHNNAAYVPGTVLVHCWRGGMRSAGVAWLLDIYGFKVHTLAGGYKAYRNWALQRFAKQYSFRVIGGYTGSGKTKVLHELARQGHVTIDLEGIVHHKGSAFGDLGQPGQPKQEMFENILAVALAETGDADIWIEDESQRVGDVNIPMVLWNTMRASPLFFLEVPFEERLKYITEEYGGFAKEKLVNATLRIQKRLGGLNTKNAVNYLNEGNVAEAFRILLAYYDKYYTKGLQNRNNPDELLTAVPCINTDATANAAHLLAAYRNFKTLTLQQQATRQ